MADSSAVRRLARRLAALEKQTRSIATQPQLPYSSMEGGALDVYDTQGSLRASLGEQADGTAAYVSLNGVTPLEPTLPMVSTGAGTLQVYWDGTFANGLPAPLDFSRVLAYALPLAGYSAPEPTNQALIVGGFQSPLGGEFAFPATPGVEYAVYLVAWNQAGQYGTASDVAFGTSLSTGGLSGPDGDPPTSSLAPTVQGQIGSLLATWPATANADAVTYEVHVKTGTASPTAGDAGSLLLETPSTQAIIRALPGGAALAYDTDYNVWVIARDADGPGPVGSYGTAQMRRVTGPDVSAEYVYAGNVSATQITAGNLDAVIALVGRLVTAKAGRRVEIGNDGIVIFEQNEDLLISFPTDPEGDFSINADVTAKRLNVLTGGDFGGFIKVKTTGVLELGSAIGGSAVPPQVAVGYEPGRRNLDAVPTSGTTFGSYTATSGWFSAYNGYRVAGVAEPGFLGFTEGGDRIEVIEDGLLTSGTVKGWFPAPSGLPVVGVVQTSLNTLYVLQRKVAGNMTSNAYWVRKYDLTGWTPGAGTSSPTLTQSTTYTAPTYSGGYGGYYQWPAIGRDETVTDGFVITAWEESSRTLDVSTSKWIHRLRARRFTAAGAQQAADGNVLLAALPAMNPAELRPLAAHYGLGDLGGSTNYFWVPVDAGTCYVFTVAGVRSSNNDFPLDGSPQGVSLFPPGSTSTVTSQAGARTGIMGSQTPLTGTTYSSIKWTTETSKWWAAFTWYDDTGTSPPTALDTYQHESSMSAVAGFTMVKRAYATVTAPRLPLADTSPTWPTIGAEEPRRVRWYLGRLAGATAPSYTAMWRQSPEPAAYDPASSTPMALTWRFGLDDPAVDFSGTSHPPATTTFPAGVAALVRPEATSGGQYIWQLKGDGSGRAGPISWDIAGKMTLVAPYLRRSKGTTDQAALPAGSGFTAITFPTAVKNIGGFTETSTAWTIPETGTYEIVIQVTWDGASVTGRRAIALTLNTTTVPTALTNTFIIAGENTAPAPAGGATNKIHTTQDFAAGDVLRLYGSQTSAQALDVLAQSTGGTEISIRKVA